MRADAAWDRHQARRTRRVLGRTDLALRPSIGYGSGGRARLMGRVLRSAPPPWGRGWGALRNGAALLRRIFSPSAPGVEVRVRFGGTEAMAVTDDAGRFDLEVQGEGGQPADGFCRAEVAVPGREGPVTAQALAAAPGPRTEFGVLSDVDDTILASDAGNVARWWLTTLVGGPYQRQPVPGVPAFYRALREGGCGGAANPFYYVSGSSWDLCDLLEEFLRHQGFPPGHVRLKDVRRGYGPERRGRQKEYKDPHMRAILDFYPGLPFILLGDAGEADAEIYAGLVRDFPGRVLAVYIRLLPGPGTGRERIRPFQEECASHGVEMVAVADTACAARHALERGWVREGAVRDLLSASV